MMRSSVQQDAHLVLTAVLLVVDTVILKRNRVPHCAHAHSNVRGCAIAAFNDGAADNSSSFATAGPLDCNGAAAVVDAAAGGADAAAGCAAEKAS